MIGFRRWMTHSGHRQIFNYSALKLGAKCLKKLQRVKGIEPSS